MPTFEATTLTCVRGERRVFADVSFRMNDGDALVLTGPNGSGKSSLLRLCAGLLPPADGHLLWDDLAVSGDPYAHCARLHYVGHLEGIKPGLSVAENLRLFAALAGDACTQATILAALEKLGIRHLSETPARFLSAGQRRRLTLSRLVAAPRPLWLLDEPATALDVAGVDLITSLIEEHRESGGQVILSTHVPFAGKSPLHLDLGPSL